MTREEAINELTEELMGINPNDLGREEIERYAVAINMAIEALKEQRPHGECKTCKHYTPYRDQFSYRNRGDGYCKSTITTSEGQAYINCHDEWYCANYEKAGEKE